MAQPTIAARPPVACAACYGQYPERIHVDFRSAIDGAQVDPTNPRSPHVDWVVMCENCIKSAYALLPEHLQVVANLESQLAAVRERAEAAENYASRLEDALQHRPDTAAPTREPRAPRNQQRSRKRKASSSTPLTAPADRPPVPSVPAQAVPAPGERQNRYARGNA